MTSQLNGDELDSLIKYMTPNGNGNNLRLSLVFGIVTFVVSAFAWTYVNNKFELVDEHEDKLPRIEAQYNEIIRRLDKIEGSIDQRGNR